MAGVVAGYLEGVARGVQVLVQRAKEFDPAAAQAFLLWLVADPHVQRLALVFGAGVGLGIILIALNAAFPAKTVGIDFDAVMERGVLTPAEYAEAKATKEREQNESFAAVRRAMIGPEPSSSAAIADGDGATQEPSAAVAAPGLRKRRGRGQRGDGDTAGAGADSDGAKTAEQKEEDGHETDEEDMNPNMTEDQLRMQKAILGTRSRTKIATMLDKAEAKIRSGNATTTGRATRNFDCVVYIVLFSLLLYALQTEYGISLPMWLSYWFPTEAAVFEGQPAQLPPDAVVLA